MCRTTNEVRGEGRFDREYTSVIQMSAKTKFLPSCSLCDAIFPRDLTVIHLLLQQVHSSVHHRYHYHLRVLWNQNGFLDMFGGGGGGGKGRERG
jgi:hypothetical protein